MDIFKSIKITIICLLALTALACDKENDLCHRIITVNNISNQDIYIGKGLSYPDTAGYKSYGVAGYLSNPMYRASKGTENSSALVQRRDCWEMEFGLSYGIPSDTLMVYIFDAEQMELHSGNENPSWKEAMLLQRYDLSLSDLRKLDFKISYPPVASMKEMKMYPPYENHR